MKLEAVYEKHRNCDCSKEPVAKDYFAVSPDGKKIIGGPYKHYDQAKREAEKQGGIVTFAEAADSKWEYHRLSKNIPDVIAAGGGYTIYVRKRGRGQSALWKTEVHTPDGDIIMLPQQNSRDAAVNVAQREVELQRSSHDSEVASEAEEGQACRPYLKIERDETKFRACQALSEKLGAIDTSEKAYEILKEAWGSEVAERFGVLTLDTHYKLRDIAETGAGETDAVMAPIVPTLQAALVSTPTYAIICHVHPAASARPSNADVSVTKSYAKAFQAVGIELLDHLILAPGSKKKFYSFRDSNPEALKP